MSPLRKAGPTRLRTRLACTLLLLEASLAAALVPATAASATASTAPAGPVVGIHDSAIRDCDHSEAATGTITTGPGKNGPRYVQAAASMNSPYWDGLHVHTVRVSVPWDIAYHHDRDPSGRANDSLEVEQACLNYWLAQAAQHGLQPQIAFKPDYNDLDTYAKNRPQHIIVPDIATYRAAVDAFTATYSNCTAHGGCALPPVPHRLAKAFPYPAHTGAMARVRVISPWGEPDFHGPGPVGFDQLPEVFYLPQGGTLDNPSCPSAATAGNCGPILAAQMWVAVEHRCHAQCTVVAGDFSGAGGLETRGRSHTYVDTYAHHLSGLRPGVWAVHPYGDIAAIEDYFSGARSTKPTLDHTTVGRFAAKLSALGYHSGTQIWLNEISTFYLRALSKTTHPGWTRAVQQRAADYLINQLVRAGGRTTAGQPTVTRLYYLRYADGPGFPYWALVVAGQPQPIYSTIAHRPNAR